MSATSLAPPTITHFGLIALRNFPNAPSDRRARAQACVTPLAACVRVSRRKAWVTKPRVAGRKAKDNARAPFPPTRKSTRAFSKVFQLFPPRFLRSLSDF